MSTNYDLAAWPLFRSVIEDGADAPPKSRRCAVIGPLADAGADARRHFEAVWRYIVKPTFLDADVAPRRIDGESEGGLATPAALQAAVDAVLDDEFVIVVAAGRSPHALYLAAVAQAAGRPMVVMLAEGEEAPAWSAGAPVAVYSLDTDAVLTAVNIRRLEAALREASEAPAERWQPFRPGASPLNAASAGGQRTFERSSMFPYERRLQMIRSAQARIDVMGLASLALAQHPDLVETLRARNGQPVELRILQSAPLNPALPSLVGGRDGQAVDRIRQEIEAAGEAWRRVIEHPDLDLSIQLRRSQTALPLASALITDRAVITTPYLASKPTAESPALYGEAGTALHRTMTQEFDAIWTDAAPLHRAERRAAKPAAANANGARPAGAPGADAFTPLTPEPAPAPAAAQPPTNGGGGLFRGFASIRGS